MFLFQSISHSFIFSVSFDLSNFLFTLNSTDTFLYALQFPSIFHWCLRNYNHNCYHPIPIHKLYILCIRWSGETRRLTWYWYFYPSGVSYDANSYQLHKNQLCQTLLFLSLGAFHFCIHCYNYHPTAAILIPLLYNFSLCVTFCYCPCSWWRNWSTQPGQRWRP